MSMPDIYQQMHPKARRRFTEILQTAAIIQVAGHADWRDYVRIARNRSVGRLRKIFQTVLDYSDEQFKSFVNKI